MDNNPKLTTLEWVEILQDERICTPQNLAIFRMLYAKPEHKASASEIGEHLGYKGRTEAPINAEMGRFAKRIAKYYEISFTKRLSGQKIYYDVPYFRNNESRSDGKLDWELRPELIKALEETGLIGASNLSTITMSGTEGGRIDVSVSVIERNPENRRKCIEHYGTICRVCGFNFNEVYGADIAKGFIHVHHHERLADAGEKAVDPITDMSPLCPNCHAAAHFKTPPFTIGELKGMRYNNQSRNNNSTS